MSKSNDWETKTLQLAMATVPAGFTRTSSTRYVSLHTGDPGETGASNEVSGSSYARTQRDASDANWPVTGNSCTNAATITFPTLSGSIGPVTHWAIWDASTSGNCLYKGAFTTGRSYVSGDAPPIAASGITITED